MWFNRLIYVKTSILLLVESMYLNVFEHSQDPTFSLVSFPFFFDVLRFEGEAVIGVDEANGLFPLLNDVYKFIHNINYVA